MNRVAWRSVRAHAKQFFLTTFAVVLGVAFLSGTLALRASMSETFSKLTSSTITSDLYVEGAKIASDGNNGSSDSTQTQPIDSSLADQIKQIDGVEAAKPDAQTTGVLVGANDTPVSNMGAPTLFLPLYDKEPGRTWAQGHMPQGGGEIALESGALKNSGLKVGDKTHIVIQGQPTEVTVVGEFHFESSMASATVVGMDPDWLMPIAAPDGKVSNITIDLAKGASLDTVKSEVTKVVPDDAQVKTRAELIKEQNKTIESQLGFVQTFLMVFVVVAMFVGSFIIMNSFAMSVRQRVKEFALLRAVGASPGSVFGIVFLQAVVIGIVGSALGVAAGAGLLAGLAKLLDNMGMPLLEGTGLTAPIIVISLVVGLAVTIIGALLPAREAALTHPVEAMRGVSGSREKSLVLRTIIGGLLLAAGAAAVAAAWVNENLEQRQLIMGLGAGGVVLGLLIVSPTLARPVVAVLGLPFRMLRPSGRLALRNIVHNPRRTANTSGALMVGMALVCAGATLAASFSASTADEIDRSLKADFLVQPATMSSSNTKLSSEKAKELAAIDGVKETSSYTLYVNAVTKPDGSQNPAATSLVIDPATYSSAYDIRVTSGSLSDLDATHVAVNKTENLKMGDKVTLTGPNGSVEATVGAIVDPKGIGGTYFYSPKVAAAVGSWTSPGTSTDPDHVLDAPLGMLLTLEDGANLDTVRHKAEDIVADTYQYSVNDASQLSDKVGQRVNQMLAVLYGLLGLSIVIAILGIVNTLVLSVSERTREIGLMRAVGLGKTQLSGEIITESVLTSLYGTVLGGATGVVLAAALKKILEDQGLTSLSVPWGQMVGMLALSVVVGIVAALWPALRASRLPVLDAIATE
ncbi:ABC transporter permease [Actinomyces naeslundii]|uniref:MacB-like periplasmic core domain protein n=2 Tax=Actinomyces naeslundii TaxID=1655 RepID=J3F3U2_ACTNH|nr:ABC transporter permease [Actinomyces naeslundii]EJN85307.1 MacB-like periplasmic core domain protein [Actinomyces naeslundii str. Howell 279]OMG35763.1 ABC transporter permease [Actinomyces naeslundii]QQC21627.1 ABC transporter permease [Actinomyces naeslundii]